MVHAGLAEWASTTGSGLQSVGERETVGDPDHVKQPLDVSRTGHEKELTFALGSDADCQIDQLDPTGVHEVQSPEVQDDRRRAALKAAIRAVYSWSLVARSSSPCGWTIRRSG
jgi:hypothetical protein